MSVTRDTFDQRVVEIEAYFSFVEDVIDRRAALIFPVPIGAKPRTKRKEQRIPIELTHTLKANGFLLLYNLVEATISNAIEEIHDAIGSDASAGTDNLNDALIKTAMARFKSGVMTITDHCKHPASRSLLRYWIEEHKDGIAREKNPLFSGNVDAKKIREVAKNYGFSADTTKRKTKDGKSLVEVKAKRNSLAHGHTAFKECGQEITMTTLLSTKTEVIHYLDEILRNIEGYITAKAYLRPPPPPATHPTAQPTV